MRKEYFIKKKGLTTNDHSEDGEFEELDLYVINSESLYKIFDLVPKLSFTERYALYVSYFKKESLEKHFDAPLISPTGILQCRQEALKKICRGILRDEIHIIFRKSYATDKNMKHSQFRDNIDDYLANELSPCDKSTFENHMLICDFCGFLFLIYRDIVEILNKCGEEIFEEIRDKQYPDSEGFVTSSKEPIPDEVSQGSSTIKMAGILKSWREKIRKSPQQLGLALILLQEDGPAFLLNLSRLIRNGSLYSNIVRFVQNIEALLIRFLIP
ncbi:MAG: hypothetical protein ACMUIM_05080 [bacterium]